MTGIGPARAVRLIRVIRVIRGRSSVLGFANTPVSVCARMMHIRGMRTLRFQSILRVAVGATFFAACRVNAQLPRRADVVIGHDVPPN